MARIVHIGAGSAGFGKRFLTDVLTRPSLRDATLVLMDVDPDNLDVMATLARRLESQRAGVRVLFMSGYDREMCTTPDLLGPNRHFLEKPFSLAALGNALTTLLADRFL